MKKLLLILILTLNFQTFSKADDIREFEIEGISLGDSLLDYYSIEEIKESLANPTFYPKSKKFKVIMFDAKNSKSYDSIQIHIKNNNTDYIIYAVKGIQFISIEKCLIRKKNAIKEIKTLIPSIIEKNYEDDYSKSFGNSKAYVNDFDLKSGASIRIWCTEWDQNNELVKKRLWENGLNISLYTKEINSFLSNEAYK